MSFDRLPTITLMMENNNIYHLIVCGCILAGVKVYRDFLLRSALLFLHMRTLRDPWLILSLDC